MESYETLSSLVFSETMGIRAPRVVRAVVRWEGTPGPASCDSTWKLPDAIEYECSAEPRNAPVDIWRPCARERRQYRCTPKRRLDFGPPTYASVCAAPPRRRRNV